MKLVIMILISFLSLSAVAEPGDVTIEDLFVDPITANSSCIDYCFEGVCFWLKCKAFPPSCSIKTSLRVSHRNPDLIVSSYPKLGANPWKEFRELFQGLQEDIGQQVINWLGSGPEQIVGGGEGVSTPSQGGGGDQTISTTFREVDAVGYFYDFVDISDELYCGNNTTSFVPHYSSAFDGFLWRTGVTDFLYTPFIFTDVIGIPYLQEWGSIYWRTGFVKQLNPAKANALLSMRAVHVASRSTEPRIYFSATGTPSSGQRFFKIPAPLEVDSDETVWQMIHPKKEDSCLVFDRVADNEDVNNDTWSEGRWSDNQSDSVYNVWRPYECCKKKGQSYLFSIQVQVCI
ncbi:TIGR03756 family integrating conjugative element protein [Aliikangiella maris]|uniref:TIGR03756 family integrating conjugative element protein n=2 Tax=Aliikangiella maris TaxID=3162458 RepID=A0ABV2BYG9_9GAMM